MWVQIALFVASLVISYMLQPKPQKSKPAAFEDFDFPTVDDGTPQIVVFGDVWLTDWTVIGVGNFRSEAIIAKQKGLFGTKKTDSGFKYFMSIHMGLSRAIDDMIEIKVSDRTVWTGNISEENTSIISINQPEIFGGDKAEGGISGQLKIMRGASDQPILNELAMMYGTVIQEGYYTYENTGDGYYSNQIKKWIPPVIEAGVVPAYRGVVTFFYDGLICSNSPYPKPWSFRVRRTTSGWDGTVWYPEKATIWLNENKIKAMNAAHILYEAQTNRNWGRGFAASQLDLESYKAVADQLFTEGFGICLAWRRQESLSEFIQQIINQIGAAHFVDRTTGLWKLVLIRDNYDLESLATYSASTGLLRIEDDNNAANDLVTNLTVVTYRDPISNQDQQIRAENLAAIQKNGAILENKSYVGIPTASLAGRLAARDMKVSQSSLKKFKLVLDRRAYSLQPASVFKISVPERGLDSIVVRAVRVEHDTMSNGEITVTVVQDVFGLPASNYIQEQPNLWQPPNLTARPVLNAKLYEVPFTELLQEISIQNLIDYPEQCYLGVLADKPNSLHLNFDVLSKYSSESKYLKVGSGDFNFCSPILNKIKQTSEPVTCQLEKSIADTFTVGDRVMIDAEVLRVDAIDIASNALTLARGCEDTVPDIHSIGAWLWLVSASPNVATQSFKPSEINTKLITRTSQDQLKEDDAPVETLQLKQRHFRPFPPANVRLNDIAYPESLSEPLQKIEWSERNRITQRIEIIDQIKPSFLPEEATTYSLLVYKKMKVLEDYILVSELYNLKATIAYADTNKGVRPSTNDFFRLNTNIGELTAVNAGKAMKTTQRICLARAQVGQKYGLLLNSNLHGAAGFTPKYVEEEFLATDSSITFLNRLKNKITSNFTEQERKSLRNGLFHSLNGGWRFEGVSGRVLEISHKYSTQQMGNVVHFVLYDQAGEVLHHHQFTSGFLSTVYFDENLERCWIWFSYEGTLDLNNDVITHNSALKTFNFDAIESTGIRFTKPPVSVPALLNTKNFSYKNEMFWIASASVGYKAPVIMMRLNHITFEQIVSTNFTNAVVNLSTPASDQMANEGKLVLKDTNLYYTEDRYYDERYPQQIKYHDVSVSKFNRETGEFIGSKILDPEISSVSAYDFLQFTYSPRIYTQTGVSTLKVDEWELGEHESNIFHVQLYDYNTAQITLRKRLNYKNRTFAFAEITQATGIYQFQNIKFKPTGFDEIYKTDTIFDTRNWSELSYTDALILKPVNILAAPEQNVTGFPEAAYMDIEFDVVGEFYFETTSSAEAGTGPNNTALFADVSDAIAVKIELWSVRDGLDSWQKQILEVDINKN